MNDTVTQEGFYVDDSYEPMDHNKTNAFTIISMEASFSTSDNTSRPVDTKYLENRIRFYENFKYWNYETNAMSVNNYDNASFVDIVKMGLDAVPFIADILEKGPHPIVHALDLIMPDVFEYKGYVSLEENCRQWLQLLRMI